MTKLVFFHIQYPIVLTIETPEPINFPFVPNGKIIVLGVPIFKHIRLFQSIIRAIPNVYMVHRK